MIFGKGECRRTRRTSNENLTKSAKIAAFWQGSFYSWLAYPLLKNVVDEKANGQTVREENKKYIADFYKYAFVGVLLEWIRNDMAESPGQIVDRVSHIVGGAIETAFANFNR